MNNLKILLADKPTGALGSKTEQEIIDLFKLLNKEGKTIIIITYNPLITSQCDRVIEIVDGAIFK